MKLHEVQPAVAALLAAEPALSAFGPIVQFSPALDIDPLRTANGAQLRSGGAVLVISGISAQRVDEPTIRGIVADVSFDVLVAENPKTPHAPALDQLVKTVTEVLAQKVGFYEPPFQFVSLDTAISEEGYVLHILGYTKRVIIP